MTVRASRAGPNTVDTNPLTPNLLVRFPPPRLPPGIFYVISIMVSTEVFSLYFHLAKLPVHNCARSHLALRLVNKARADAQKFPKGEYRG